MYGIIEKKSISIVFPGRFPYLFTMTNVAVGIIIQTNTSALDSNRVLMCQRKPTAAYPLKWEFPGGKVENAETIKDCLRRELLEELGIHADIGELFHRQQYVYPDSGTFDIFYHLVQSHSGTISNRAFSAIQWVPMNQLPQLDILEGNRDVVQKLLHMNGHAGSITG